MSDAALVRLANGLILAGRQEREQLQDDLADRDARIDAALALADRWTAIHGHDQRAATHHALADNLREVLDPKESQR